MAAKLTGTSNPGILRVGAGDRGEVVMVTVLQLGLSATALHIVQPDFTSSLTKMCLHERNVPQTNDGGKLALYYHEQESYVSGRSQWVESVGGVSGRSL